MDDGLHIYIREIRKIPDLDEDAEKALFKRVAADDQKAVDRIAESYMKKVLDTAEQYIKRDQKINGVDLLDLIQEGNTGLLRAVYKYKPASDYQFWDYAEWWVRKEIEKKLKNS